MLIVSFNLALGAEAEQGGIDGQGIGGGVVRLGVYSADGATLIRKNHATSSHDNVTP